MHTQMITKNKKYIYLDKNTCIKIKIILQI